MRLIRAIVPVLLFWYSVLPLPAPAEQELILDIETAVTTALENNLGLQSQNLELAGLERARRAAWNSFLPTASARVSTSRGLLGSGAGLWNLSFGLQAGLSLAGDSGYEIRGALLDYQLGLIDAETARKRLERDVCIAYYGLLLKRSEGELIARNIETSAQRYALARESYERGRASELEMLNALVALENQKPKLAEANLAYATAMMRFKQALGLDLEKEIRLTGSIETLEPALPAEDSVSRYLPGRLDMLALVKEREILENRKTKSAFEEFVPDLSVSYSYTPNLEQPWSSGWETRSSLGLTVSIPLDPWLPLSAGRVRRQEIRDDLEAKALELAAQRLEAQIEIRSLLLEVENARRFIRVAEQNAELARRVYALTEQEFDAGVSDFLTLQEADDDLREAQLEVLTAGYDFRVGLLRLEYALNTRLAP
jgi:outer membrane protein TolC